MRIANKRKVFLASLITGLVLSLIFVLGFTSIGAELSPALIDKVIWDDSPIQVEFVKTGVYFIFVKRIYTTEAHSQDSDLNWRVSIWGWDEKTEAYISVLDTDYQNFELNRFYVWGFTINKPGTYRVGVYNNLRCYCQTSKFQIVIKPGLLT